MSYLLDTHLLLWIAEDSQKLPPRVSTMLDDPDARLIFSTASIWEVAIKGALGRPDFQVDAGLLLRGLLDYGFEELPVIGRHAVRVQALPRHHRDPFDRLLIGQAMEESLTLLTADKAVLRYEGPIEAA